MTVQKRRRRRLALSVVLGTLALLLLRARPVEALCLEWDTNTATCAGADQSCSDMQAKLDGAPAANFYDGEMCFDGRDACDPHLVSMCTSFCYCPLSTPLDDIGEFDVRCTDPEEGTSIECASGIALGDNCGADMTCIDVPVPGECGDCDSESGYPVQYASGHMRTLPQVDLVVSDPFFPIRLEREYFSASMTDSVLGWGWKFTDYDIKLRPISTMSGFRLSHNRMSMTVKTQCWST